MKTTLKTTLIVILGIAVLIGFCVWSISVRFATRAVDNVVDYAEHKIDEATNYELIKEVEDTCRAMISSYEADKLMWEQYKDSEDKEEKSWSNQAKNRANRTASTYNNYILTNSFVWADNVPDDIADKLPVIE